MPIVQIHLLEGRSLEQKKQLVSEVTGAICRSIEVKPEQVRIILQEMSMDCYSVGGGLFSEKGS
ncbi:MAG: 2-hydroxymuconate tautomerase family protein [Synergistales bacterium]|nr:2-hydroxymuconate tautomerase family protein [Synergistales bacterium]